MRALLLALLLAVPAHAQVGSCTYYAGSPTLTKTACSTAPRIGQSFDLWWPQVTRALAPPATIQAMYMGPVSASSVISWGPAPDQQLLGWLPNFQVATRILDSNNPGPWPPASCSIPLQTCTWNATPAYTVAVPNDPALIGVVWRAGVINAWIGGIPPIILDPRHMNSDVTLTIGQ